MEGWKLLPVFFVLFGRENESYEFLLKTISNMADSSKNILKIKMLQKERAKKVKYYNIDF